MPFIVVNKLNLYFQLRRSARAKRLQLRFHYDRFEVIAPRRLSNREIISFVWDSRQWMSRVHSKRSVQDPSQDKINLFCEGNKLYYRGRYWSVSFCKGATFKIEPLGEDKMICTLPDGEPHQHHALLEQWFQEQTYVIIHSVVQRVCPILGKWPRKIVLKQQKTRWGSCGINDAIQINWRLIFAPEGILEYVVVHELCHLLHRNHGIRFWKTVAKFFPQHALSRKWLRKEGDPLLRINLETSFCSQESFRSLVESL